MAIYKWKLVLLLFTIFVSCSAFLFRRRIKRSVFDLGDMIGFTTGRRGLDFNKYGNFCGKGGEGRILDQIDWCCRIHDYCYGYIQNWKCHVYMKSYQWAIVNYQIQCSSRDMCQRASCECDKNLAYCLGRFHVFYNQSLAPQSNFLNFVHRVGHILSNNRF